ADTDPVDRARLPDHAQEGARSLRFDLPFGQHPELADRPVDDRHRNGQYAGGLKREVLHMWHLHTVMYGSHKHASRRCQYTTVWSRMTKRLSADAWIDFALATLAREGFAALKADVLARKLNVSRGSFYWHFADIETFHARVIARWRQVATEAIIA